MGLSVPYVCSECWQATSLQVPSLIEESYRPLGAKTGVLQWVLKGVQD